jgi:hypothetical protein
MVVLLKKEALKPLHERGNLMSAQKLTSAEEAFRQQSSQMVNRYKAEIDRLAGEDENLTVHPQQLVITWPQRGEIKT